MQNVRNRLGLWLLTLVTLGTAPATGSAEFLSGSNGLSNLGSFEGTFTYAPASATQATLVVTLTNTSPSANGGYLTGFVFNNPADRITAAALMAGDADFELLGVPGIDDGINGAPFGHFDLGAATGGSFLGGGKPSKGLGVGSAAAFTFTLTGSGLDLLTSQSFFATLSEHQGAGQGHQAFVARFRGFEDGGSDKVPGTLAPPEPLPGAGPLVPPESLPEPGTLALGSIGLLGLLAYCRWKKCLTPS